MVSKKLINFFILLVHTPSLVKFSPHTHIYIYISLNQSCKNKYTRNNKNLIDQRIYTESAENLIIRLYRPNLDSISVVIM